MIRDLETILNQSTGRVDLDPADTFLLDNPINLRERDVELYGHGASLQYRTRQKKKSAPFIAGRNLSGVIDGLVIIGQKDPAQGYVVSREGHAGFWIAGADDLTISNCTVQHVPGDFAYFGCVKGGSAKKGGVWHKPCRNVLLSDFHGIDAGRHAIAAVGVETVGETPGLMIGFTCSFHGWKRARIDLERTIGFKSKPSAVFNLCTVWKKQ